MQRADRSGQRRVRAARRHQCLQVPRPERRGRVEHDRAGRQIELWHTGYLDVPAAEGQQFAELSANEPGELYQERATVPGTPLTYVVSHRGRSGVDTMAINIGPPGGPPTLSRNVSTGNTDWQQVFGRYVVPAGQTVTRFGFAAVQNASGNPSIGNFLDGIVFSAARCSVTVTKRLAPASARGRFDLLVGDEVVAAGAGNGDTSGPVAVPLDTVRISEQAASGTDPDRYASAIRCVDAATGASVAQAFGRETTVRFDRPRDVACVVANVVPPAILVEKVMAPDGCRPVRPARQRQGRRGGRRRPHDRRPRARRLPPGHRVRARRAGNRPGRLRHGDRVPVAGRFRSRRGDRPCAERDLRHPAAVGRPLRPAQSRQAAAVAALPAVAFAARAAAGLTGRRQGRARSRPADPRARAGHRPRRARPLPHPGDEPRPAPGHARADRPVPPAGRGAPARPPALDPGRRW